MADFSLLESNTRGESKTCGSADKCATASDGIYGCRLVELPALEACVTWGGKADYGFGNFNILLTGRKGTRFLKILGIFS